MHVQNTQVPRKPYMSFAYVQGGEVCIVKGHVSLRAAKRTAQASMRKLRGVNPSSSLLSWGYQDVSAADRAHGVVI